MAKLLQRLGDAAKSGVYRASRLDAIEDALRGSRLGFARIGLQDVTEKSALLRRIAATLGFPGWFGENWDALEAASRIYRGGRGQGTSWFRGFPVSPDRGAGRADRRDDLGGAVLGW
jgi:hypothetical protein